MVLFNYTTKELTAKIVYYGPGLCGKTTNLQFIYDSLPGHVKKGKMLSLATKTDRTLFFDFLPIELGRIRGMRTRIQLYTVPGQVFYNSTRKLVLKGADGVVFVADSQQKMMESNIESYKNLDENLQEIGLNLEELPLVMQFNKRDLPNLASVEEMNTLINRHNAPFYEAVATTGIGVEDTLKAITKLVLNHLAAKYHLGVPSGEKIGREAAASPMPRPLPAEDYPPSRKAPYSGEGIAEAPADDDAEIGAAAMASPSPSRGRGPTAADPEELEILDLDDENKEISSSPEAARRGAAVDGGQDDFSDLLEEIPEDTPEDVLEVLEEAPELQPTPPPLVPRFSSPVRGLVPASSEPIPTATTRLQSANLPPSRSDISPTDPLGIITTRRGEMSSAPPIQVGAVIPGKQHQITVPLEMSVDGRKVRLQLRMTLTLSL